MLTLTDKQAITTVLDLLRHQIGYIDEHLQKEGDTITLHRLTQRLHELCDAWDTVSNLEGY